MNSQQKGFTLVELIVVIVILGILAATALPRFINVTTEAQVASIRGFAGGVSSAVSVIQAGWMATGGTSSGVNTPGSATPVAVASGTGIPDGTAAGIGAAIRCNGTDCNGFTADYTTATAVTFRPTGQTLCGVTYNGTTGAVTTDTDCGS